ncbi:tyrosine-type recombinase/integrase [Sporosarcina sp. P2]|uniref:tyrosine-type recombinase/integrase n=1 Tax=Sporosarcina sp. P2 TaxID=2048251 RepID=UPI001E442D64|nr:tyrosine-type recombinase/integrase [Sporosarcina sp. P2]
MLERFQQWLIEDGKSPKTVESYCNDVKQFQKYLQKEAVNEETSLSRYSFVRYKQHLLDEGFEVSTINNKVNSLKVYNDYLQMKGIVDDNYIQVSKDRVAIASGSEQMVEALTDIEVDRILAYAEDENHMSIRNRLIIHLLLYTAVRVSELVSIKLNDIDFVQHTLMVRGKGGKVIKPVHHTIQITKLAS